MSRKFALIIGNSEYADKNLACLKTPEADVRALAEVLLDPKIGGFDEAPTLINESDSTIRKAIERFFARKKSDDLLLLYFSGHGVLDDQGRLYLAAKDTEYELWSASAIPASFITDSMDRSQSKRQVLILDCCHSGAFFRGTKAVTGAKAVTETTFEGKGYGKVVLTATDTTQYAWENDQVIGETENSIFTHFLIEGLKTGEADTDSDGRITLDELYDYVHKKLADTTSKQTPRKWAYNQQGTLMIAANPSPIVKPAPLPDELMQALEHTSSFVREGAVRELEQLLQSRNKGLALSAGEQLERIASDDDSRRVAKLAAEILERNAENVTQAPATDLSQEAEASEELQAVNEQLEKEKEEEQKRIKIAALYGEAEAAIAKKDWSAAVDKLEAVLALNPGHTEAAAKLKDVDKQIEEAERRDEIGALGAEAREAERNEDWATAVQKRELLLALDPSQPEAKDELNHARKQQQLATLYAKGQESYANREWSKALDYFGRVKGLKPSYKDVIVLIDEIQSKMLEEAEGKRVENTQPELAKEAKPEPPPPLEPTTPPTPPASVEPEPSQSSFTNYTSTEQKRNLRPLIVGAVVVFAIVASVVGYISMSNSRRPSIDYPNANAAPANTQSYPTNSNLKSNMNQGNMSQGMATSTSSPKASPSPTLGTEIEQEDFEQYTYDVYWEKARPIDRERKLTIKYGDLDRDGNEEAAVNVSIPAREGNDFLETIFVFTKKNGILQQLTKHDCEFHIARTSIEGGLLKVGCYDAGHPLAKFIIITSYRLEGRKLVPVGNPVKVKNTDY